MMIFKFKNSVNLRRVNKFSTQMKKKLNLYTNTILLPQTTLPLRLDNKKLIDRDSALNNVRIE